MFDKSSASRDHGTIHVHLLKSALWTQIADCWVGSVPSPGYQAVCRWRCPDPPLWQDAQKCHRWRLLVGLGSYESPNIRLGQGLLQRAPSEQTSPRRPQTCRRSNSRPIRSRCLGASPYNRKSLPSQARPAWSEIEAWRQTPAKTRSDQQYDP